MRRTCQRLLCSLVFLAPVLAGAQEATSLPPESVTGEDLSGVGGAVETMHDEISDGILKITHRFDSFFGEDIIDDDQDDTLIRLQLTGDFGENNRSAFNNRLSVRLKLPQLSNRVQLIFDDIVEKNEKKDIVQEVKDSEPLTGLRYAVEENRLRFNVDAGVKVRMEPDAFVRARLRKIFDLEPWSLKLSQDVYWLMRDGPGEVTQAKLSRRLNHDYLFKSTTSAKWDESHDGITYSQALSLYQELSKRKALRYTVAASMPTSPITTIDEYQAFITWRQLAYSDWCYIEIEPQASFPRDRDYTFTPTIMFKLDLMFGDSPNGFWQ